MRISIDTDRCVGAGQCVLSAPDVFDQNDDGLVIVLATEPADSDGKAVRQAQEICPSQAITLN
ncbi:ferredoxin [Amycolatopsis sp.]|jgi:ferredoxin|uniref:ferredoxin n=1 Tax=Amycolatopsis sp. TaxID=37632 RepID=UPI002E05B996|nr:ferredoxin [Amycolatopsis sp.]